MPAVDWDHFMPWQTDILPAFHALQRQVGDDLGLTPQAAAIKALMDGTHSVLDLIGGTSPKNYLERDPSELLMAFAAPDAWLQETYGTARPTRKMVTEKLMKQLQTLERGTAIYFAVWGLEGADVDPTWWYFHGVSGD